MSKKCKKWKCVYHACMSDDCQYDEVIKSGGDFGMTQCDQDHYEEELKLMRMNMEISIYEN